MGERTRVGAYMATLWWLYGLVTMWLRFGGYMVSLVAIWFGASVVGAYEVGPYLMKYKKYDALKFFY